MTSSNGVFIHITKLLEYLAISELAIITNGPVMRNSRVSWASSSETPFLTFRKHATIAQYLEWAKASAYSAVLMDGSLLQLTYDFDDGKVSRHRLAYIPCPFVVDTELLLEIPFIDVIESYADSPDTEVALKSHVRFDFDQKAAKPGHPAAHLTINSPDCRIACAAPIHPHQFADFVFRHFYPEYRAVHSDYFDPAARTRLGDVVIEDSERSDLHLMWTN